MKRNIPLVSIITVTYNSEKYLEDTINSIKNQSYPNIEYLVIDGSSSDNTVKIIRKNEAFIDFWISEHDNGIYHAMNKGIKRANGDIIGIVNSDDWLESDAIKKVVKTSTSLLTDEFVIHGKIVTYNKRNKFIMERAPKKIPYYHLFATPFKHPAMFVSKKLYENVGLYDENCGLAADYDLMLRIINWGAKSIFIDEVLSNVRLVGISTGHNINASNMELYYILKKNTGANIVALFAMTVRIIRQFFKKK